MSDFIYNETGYALDNDNGNIVLSDKSYQRYFARFYKDYVFYRDAEFLEVIHDIDNNQFILKYEIEKELCEDYITYKTVELFIFE